MNQKNYVNEDSQNTSKTVVNKRLCNCTKVTEAVIGRDTCRRSLVCKRSRVICFTSDNFSHCRPHYYGSLEEILRHILSSSNRCSFNLAYRHGTFVRSHILETNISNHESHMPCIFSITHAEFKRSIFGLMFCNTVSTKKYSH